jgi:DNA-directed RNA polymerase subunit RPC12/RpoP
MSADIIELNDRRSRVSKYVACMDCGHDWEAKAPDGTTALKCPSCGSMSGGVVNPEDAEFFKDFMGRADGNETWHKRMAVLINAKKMIDKGEYTP